jgi:predicted transcriptional regulator
MAEANESEVNLLALTADIVAGYAAHNSVSGSDLPKLIQNTYQALSSLGEGSLDAAAPNEHLPAVSVRKSLADPNFLVSLIDGKPYTALKRHLTKHGLTPEEYRQRYGLKADYPMTAPAYSEKRRTLAKAIGLGRNHGTKASSGRKASPRRTNA